MELVKIIITTNQGFLRQIKERFNLNQIKKNNELNIYEGIREANEGKEKIIMVLSGRTQKDIKYSIDYIFDNFIPDKIINIGFAQILDYQETRIGDVLIPNTFINKNKIKNEAIFINYAIGESYDLKKFGLILNGICITGNKHIDNNKKIIDIKNELGGDIYDTEVYDFLSNIKKRQASLDNCVVIKTVFDGIKTPEKKENFEEIDFVIKNGTDVLELII